MNLSNPSWGAETPFETSQRASKLSRVHEGIVGGPLVKDQLWFFGAGRWERSSTQGAFPQTAAPLVTETNNDRYELKLTGSLGPGHTLRGTFVDNDLTGAQASLPFSIDPRAYVRPHTPNRLFVANYAGAVGSRLLATAQYSQKHWGVRNNGNTSTDILDSPFLTRTGAMYQYNAPYFDSTDPEDRNNRQATASVAYFASTPKLGSHDLKGGVEQFTSTQDRRQLADVHGLRVSRGFRYRTQRRAASRRQRSDRSPVRARVYPAADLDARSWSSDRHRHDVALPAGSDFRRSASLIGPGSPLRTRDQRRHGGDERHQRQYHRAAPWCQLRPRWRRQDGHPCHLRTLCRQVQ